MPNLRYKSPKIPDAPRAIQKGVALKNLLNSETIAYLARNIALVNKTFDKAAFAHDAEQGLEDLGIMDRGKAIACALQRHLPDNYEEALETLLRSLTPAKVEAEEFGLAAFFYLPHSAFIGEYGLNEDYSNNQDPFEISLMAQYELTQRFTAEFSIRPFLIAQQERTLDKINTWLQDPNPHVRRFCSEGTRPKLPWGKRIPSFIDDPMPLFPILEALKDDPVLYVRRSVANHLGDIAKDHPEKVFELCDTWLSNASKERKWLIRHALRHPAKKENKTALKLRAAAK